MSLRDKVQAILGGSDATAAAARTRYRDAAVNWIAVGVMLSAWHLESRLERLPGAPNAHVAKGSSGRDTQLWDEGAQKPSWITRALSGAPLIGVRHIVPPSSVYTPVSTLRQVRRWLPGI